MSKYETYIVRTQYVRVVVDAENQDQATQKVWDMAMDNPPDWNDQASVTDSEIRVYVEGLIEEETSNG